MYNVFGREYEFAITVAIPVLERTTQYTDWLRESVGPENAIWAYGFVKVSDDFLIFRFFFKEDNHMAMFKLAML